MKKGYFLPLLLITLTVPAFAAEPSSPSKQQQDQSPSKGPGSRVTSAGLESLDRQFAMEAAMGGMAEVAAGRLAAQKASNAEVKRFGQRMVDDHTKANQELKQLASKKNITLPPDTMAGDSAGHAGHDMQPHKGMHGGMTMDPADHKAMMDKLSGLSGAEFDREYMSGMLKDHEKTIMLFEQQVSQGTDKELQAFARKTLPTLREHQRMAKQVASSVGVTGAAR